jgi:carbon storage regulator CsrA
MLVLSRRIDERIVIDGGRIVIMVVDMKNNETVRIGVTADPSIRVDREEVHLARTRDPRPPQARPD